VTTIYVNFLMIRYHAEPSGTFYRYDAKAIGSGSEGAQAELQNEYFKVESYLTDD
jgi:20S proteasome alpha/beta subunit